MAPPFPPTANVALARELVLALPLATAALSTDGAAALLATVAQVATLRIGKSPRCAEKSVPNVYSGEAVGILISKGTYFMDLIRHTTVTKTTTAPTTSQSLAITEWEVADKHLYLSR